MVAERLQRAMDAAQIPIVGVSIRDESDPRTWRAFYTDDATVEQRAAGDALIAAFDPDSQEVVAAEEAAAMQGVITAPMRAFWLFLERKLLGRDPTDDERAEDMAALLTAFKDVGQ